MKDLTSSFFLFLFILLVYFLSTLNALLRSSSMDLNKYISKPGFVSRTVTSGFVNLTVLTTFPENINGPNEGLRADAIGYFNRHFFCGAIWISF